MSQYRVTLFAPDGREVVAHSPGEANDLRYGLGYRLKSPAEPAAPTPPAPSETKPPRETAKAKPADPK